MACCPTHSGGARSYFPVSPFTHSPRAVMRSPATSNRYGLLGRCKVFQPERASSSDAPSSAIAITVPKRNGQCRKSRSYWHRAGPGAGRRSRAAEYAWLAFYFWTMLVLVIAVLAWAARSLPETLPKAHRRPLHPHVLWTNYRRVLLAPDFLLLAAIPTLNFAALLLYIASAPTDLVDLLGVTTWGFAWLFIPAISGIMVGAMISGRLAGRKTLKRTIRLGYALMFVGAALNILVAAFVPPGAPRHVMPWFVFTMGTSIVMPSLTLILLDCFPRCADWCRC